MSGRIDPWHATWEEALAAYHASGERGFDNPVAQWGAAQQINALLKDKVLAGDGFAVLDAVSRCARSNLLMPDWLAVAFIQRYDQVLNARVGSWDEAFGAPYPDRARLATARLKRRKVIELMVFFSGPDAPPRGPKGWKLAAEACGITAKQAKQWTPKTRKNVRGNQALRVALQSKSAASDPFGLIGRV